MRPLLSQMRRSFELCYRRSIMKQKNVIAFCLVGLPVGLMLFGVGSMIYTEVLAKTPAGHAQAEAREKNAKYASLLREQVKAESLKRHVTLLSEDIGARNLRHPDGLESAALLLESSMGPSNMGYQIKLHPYEVDGVEVRNVEAVLPGVSESRKDEIVIVGAHYDSAANTPGADDNASGVAALLALANAFVATRNERTIRFVGFVNEEPPYFQTSSMGSLVYARECKANKEDVVAMMALESMGYFSDEPGSQMYPKLIADKYPSVGNFIAFIGNVSSGKLVHQTHAAFQATTDFPAEKGVFPAGIEGIGWSDHWSFWENGYPAIMVTDTAVFRNPHYHKPTDTVEKLDFERLADVVAGLVAVIERLANPDASAKVDANTAAAANK